MKSFQNINIEAWTGISWTVQEVVSLAAKNVQTELAAKTRAWGWSGIWANLLKPYHWSRVAKCQMINIQNLTPRKNVESGQSSKTEAHWENSVPPKIFSYAKYCGQKYSRNRIKMVPGNLFLHPFKIPITKWCGREKEKGGTWEKQPNQDRTLPERQQLDIGHILFVDLTLINLRRWNINCFERMGKNFWEVCFVAGATNC